MVPLQQRRLDVSYKDTLATQHGKRVVAVAIARRANHHHVLGDERPCQDFAADRFAPTLAAIGGIERDDVAVARAEHEQSAVDFRAGEHDWGFWDTAIFQAAVPPPPGQSLPVATIGELELVARTPGGTSVLGFAPVMPMVVVSVLMMWIVSLVTRPPSAATVRRYDV